MSNVTSSEPRIVQRRNFSVRRGTETVKTTVYQWNHNSQYATKEAWQEQNNRERELLRRI